MLVLAIDASLGPVSAALFDTADGRCVLRHDDAAEGRAERLPMHVADLLADAGVAPADLDRIAVTTGPGGFTGVRVGIAFARGFALVHGTPVVGVETLTALALSAGAPESGDGRHAGVLAFVHGRKGRLLARRFDGAGSPLGPVEEIAAAALATTAPGARLAGPDAERLAPGRPSITAVSVVALARHAATLNPAGHPPEPTYAAPPDAIAPAPSRLLAAPVPARAEMPTRPVAAASTIGEQ
jgi:tRNA threonylcarbamoyladenosine biosynthesis protein TsaB